jgi:V/A-type H+-transporting ATPase subunit I
MYILTNSIVGIFGGVPTWAFWMFGVSFLTVFIQAKGMDKGMLFLNAMSVLGDVISYVRLFAVGLASVQVAGNFNAMALDLGLPLWIKWLPVVLIMLVGHGLNIAMAGLSVLVHAVRLNTLEFSNHKGVSWAGYAFRPFKRKT